MAYATRAELTTLAIPASALGGISTERQDAALEAASRLADGYLNARYRLPLTSYGSDLKRAVCDIAAFILMKARGFSPETADADMLQTAERSAVKWLEGIAAGKISPYGLSDSGPSGANTEDVSEASHAPLVVQVQEGTPERGEFWSGTTLEGGGGVGTPRRRGW